MSDNIPAALTVILAEFQTIRAAIDRKATSVVNLIGFNFTVVAAVSGFVLGNKADPRLLLVLPITSSGLGLLVFDYMRDIGIARRYIRDTLQPLAAQYADNEQVLAYAGQTTYSPPIVILARWVPYGLLFPAVSIISLLAVIGIFIH